MDDFFQLHTFEISLPGLTSPKTVLHFSDMHLCIRDDLSTDEEGEIAERHAADWITGRIFFAKSCGDQYDAPHMIPDYEMPGKYKSLALECGADAVICTGDLWECYLPANARFTRNALRDFPVPFLWARGNHESDDNPVYAELMNGDPSVQVLALDTLKLIALDNSRRSFSAEQLARIQAEVSDGCAAVLCYHIPLRTDCNRDELLRQDAYFSIGCGEGGESTDQVIHWLSSPSCPVSLTLAGHLHVPSDTLLGEACRQIVVSSALVGNANLYRFLPML